MAESRKGSVTERATGKDEDENMYEAMYGYDATRKGDLTFLPGDLLVVSGPQVGTWWWARNPRTGQEGYVPHNFVSSKPSTAGPSGSSIRTLRANMDYTAASPTGLSFKRDQLIEITGEEEEGWVRGRLEGTSTEGLVSVACLDEGDPLDIQEWYHGALSRDAAETLLLSEATNGREGTFLIRESSQANAAHSITVMGKGMYGDDAIKPRHYMIHQNQLGRWFVSQNLTFSNLADLVLHYSTQSGLCALLKWPAKREEPQPPPPTQPTSSDNPPEDVSTSSGSRGEDPWEVDRECVALGEELGHGQFGQVYRAKWNDTFDVAVKAMKEDCMKREEFLREGATMRRLRHPKLVKLLGVVTLPPDQPLLLITELVPHGDLLTHLRTIYENRNPHSNGVLTKMSAQVASGMAYLEGEKVIHRDLAARNILLTNNLYIKIADFGLARFIKGDFYLRKSNMKFPIKWTSPESLLHNLFTSKSDVWSFGILMYEIFTHGGIPYPGIGNKDSRDLIITGEINLCPPGCPPYIYTIMKECWSLDPDSRPSFASLVPILEVLAKRFTSVEQL